MIMRSDITIIWTFRVYTSNLRYCPWPHLLRVPLQYMAYNPLSCVISSTWQALNICSWNEGMNDWMNEVMKVSFINRFQPVIFVKNNQIWKLKKQKQNWLEYFSEKSQDLVMGCLSNLRLFSFHNAPILTSLCNFYKWGFVLTSKQSSSGHCHGGWEEN